MIYLELDVAISNIYLSHTYLSVTYLRFAMRIMRKCSSYFIDMLYIVPDIVCQHNN